MAKSATTINDFDPNIVNMLLSRLDTKDSDLLTERGSYMSRCRGHRDEIKSIYDDAKAKGIPVKELKTLVKIRQGERRNMSLYQNLEAEEQQNLARLAATERVMDLPLWRSTAPEAELPREVDPDSQGLRHARFKPLN